MTHTGVCHLFKLTMSQLTIEKVTWFLQHVFCRETIQAHSLVPEPMFLIRVPSCRILLTGTFQSRRNVFPCTQFQDVTFWKGALPCDRLEHYFRVYQFCLRKSHLVCVAHPVFAVSVTNRLDFIFLLSGISNLTSFICSNITREHDNC